MRVSSLDTETALSEPGIGAPRVICGSVCEPERPSQLLTRAATLAWFRAWVSSGDHLVGCNIVYDLCCIAAASQQHGSLCEASIGLPCDIGCGDDLLPVIFAVLDAGRVHDIAIREALIDIARGDLLERGEDGIGIRYGMRILSQRYLPEQAAQVIADKRGPDTWRKRYATLEHVPLEQWPEDARAYPLRDASQTLQIFHKQEGGENLHDEANQVRAAFALQLMSVWGMRSNPAAVAKLRSRVEAADRKCVADFQASGILRPDGTQNSKRLAELVTIAYGGSPPMTAPTSRHPKGQVSTDRDTLAESGDPTLERYATAGKNDKYLTTYLPILEQGIEQPWNPQFNVLVATTRVSSDAQQFPQVGGVRECWEARLRHVICSVDYSGLELRTMSQRAIAEVGYSLMAEAMNGGRDPHLIAAASFQGLTYDEAVKRYAAGDPLVKAFRDLGKIWNFGKGGGMGPGAMTYNARKGSKGETTTAPDGTVYVGARFCLLAKKATRCGVVKVLTKVQGKQRRICAECLAVAKHLDQGWLQAWPEQRDLFAMASRLSKQSRHVDALIPVSKIKRGKCGYTQWLNTPFQGLGAAAAKRAMWIVSREMYTRRESPLWGSRLLLNVHDELIAEMPEDRAPEAGDRMALIMREVLKRFVPDLAKSVEAEPALSRTMSKKAQTVRDVNGRLQVWEAKAA